MSNLPILERMLGSLDLWPRDILRYLFLVSPTPHTLHELALFFFGNDIPLVLALDFFENVLVPLPPLNIWPPYVTYTLLSTPMNRTVSNTMI